MNHSSSNCPKYVRRTAIRPVKNGLKEPVIHQWSVHVVRIKGFQRSRQCKEPAIDHWSVPDYCRDFALRSVPGTP